MFFNTVLSSFANRLTHIKENHKFQKDGQEGSRVEDPALGLCHVVTEIKDKHKLKYDSECTQITRGFLFNMICYR